MASGLQPLDVDTEQQQTQAREVVHARRRAFCSCVSAGGLACVGLAVIALVHRDALESHHAKKFVGARGDLSQEPIRAGFKSQQIAHGRAAPVMRTLAEPDMSSESLSTSDQKNAMTRRQTLFGLGIVAVPGLPGVNQLAFAEEGPKFKSINPIQFIAALGDPEASSGTGADKWGLWRKDPGPRGVYLREYEQKLAANGNKAPAGWSFDPSSWWVEEHGLIMETPSPLPLQKMQQMDNAEMKVVAPEKRYVVTGGRQTTSILTVHSDGRWELSKGKLYDVTHLPCRSAVYTPAKGGECRPTKEQQKSFPVEPGAKMPTFEGCNTQDWAVLFVTGEDV